MLLRGLPTLVRETSAAGAVTYGCLWPLPEPLLRLLLLLLLQVVCSALGAAQLLRVAHGARAAVPSRACACAGFGRELEPAGGSRQRV
jgi:hypothetical protein